MSVTIADFVHGYMAGTLDEGLHVFLPGSHHEFTHGVEFGKLSGIVGIGRTARAQSVAKRQGYIVFRHDIADVVEVLVKETLLIVDEAPLAHDAAATAHDAAQATVGQVDVVATDAGMVK